MIVVAMQGDGFSQECFPCILYCFPTMGVLDLKTPTLLSLRSFFMSFAFNLKIVFNIFKAEPYLAMLLNPAYVKKLYFSVEEITSS